MKKIIFAKLLERLRETPNLKKKVKIFLGVGIIGLFFAGALSVYIGVASFRYLANLGASIDVAQHAETVKSKVQEIPALAKTECLGTLQGLLNFEKIIATPMKDNFLALKNACTNEAKPEPLSEPKKESELI